VPSDRQPASSQTTRPVSAEPTRALPTSKNLRSAAFTSAPAPRQPSTEKPGQLPTCCPPNPACCRPSAPAVGCAQPALFRACTSSVATFAVHKLPAACISSKRGQLCSVTWSCSDIPLVLHDCASTPHWCYVVVSQSMYTPTPALVNVLSPPTFPLVE
jgi:hypothetical protein